MSSASDVSILIQGIFNNMQFLGEPIIIPLILTAITVLLLSRKPDKWGVLAFPVMLGWKVAGVNINAIILIIAGLVFVITSLGTTTITSTLSTGASNLRNIFTLGGSTTGSVRRREAAQKRREIEKGRIGLGFDAQLTDIERAKELSREKSRLPWDIAKARYEDINKEGMEGVNYKRALYQSQWDKKVKGDIASWERKQLREAGQGIFPLNNVATIGKRAKYKPATMSKYSKAVNEAIGVIRQDHRTLDYKKFKRIKRRDSQPLRQM